MKVAPPRRFHRTPRDGARGSPVIETVEPRTPGRAAPRPTPRKEQTRRRNQRNQSGSIVTPERNAVSQRRAGRVADSNHLRGVFEFLREHIVTRAGASGFINHALQLGAEFRECERWVKFQGFPFSKNHLVILSDSQATDCQAQIGRVGNAVIASAKSCTTRCKRMQTRVSDRIALYSRMAMEGALDLSRLAVKLGYRGEGFGEFHCNALSV
jgi:hypothetical protein